MECIKNSRFCVCVSSGETGFIIYSLKDLKYEKEWIYSENTVTKDRDISKAYDEQYAGGIEFLFPSDEKETFENHVYEDHGFLWRMKYRLTAEADKLEAEAFDEKTGIRSVYKIELLEESILLDIEITNDSKLPIPYLARLHPAFLTGKNTVLGLQIKEVSFEKDALYCSFYPESAVGTTDIIYTKDKEQLYLEQPATWGEHEIFCHIRQKKGEFFIKEADRKLSFKYDRKKMPYLTLYSFVKNGRRICIPEPANAPGTSLNSIEKKQEVPGLMPGEKINHTFEIIPE